MDSDVPTLDIRTEDQLKNPETVNFQFFSCVLKRVMVVENRRIITPYEQGRNEYMVVHDKRTRCIICPEEYNSTHNENRRIECQVIPQRLSGFKKTLIFLMKICSANYKIQTIWIIDTLKNRVAEFGLTK